MGIAGALPFINFTLPSVASLSPFISSLMYVSKYSTETSEIIFPFLLNTPSYIIPWRTKSKEHFSFFAEVCKINVNDRKPRLHLAFFKSKVLFIFQISIVGDNAVFKRKGNKTDKNSVYKSLNTQFPELYVGTIYVLGLAYRSFCVFPKTPIQQRFSCCPPYPLSLMKRAKRYWLNAMK